MIRLRPIRDDEFGEFLAASREEYADDMARHGGLAPEAAEEKARADFESLFPGGARSPAQIVLVVEEAATGRTVGRLWYSELERPGERVVWLYDIAIEPSDRGRGLGREAMLRLEDEARARGLARVELNVMGGNQMARRLYRSLGYAELSLQMGKNVRDA